MTLEFWNERYREAEPAYGHEPNEFLKTQLGCFAPGGDVLCLGEGEGRNAVWLASKGMRVSALDYAEAGLDRTRELARERGVEVALIHADLATHELGPNTYDGIVSIFVHLPATLRRSVHRAAMASLKPGGKFVAEYFSPDQLALGTGGPKDAALLYDPEDLREDFASSRILLLENKEVALREGRYHQGRASVVRVVVSREE